MSELEELKKAIETARKDLEASMQNDTFEIYYEKSKKLDKLIEEYIDFQK